MMDELIDKKDEIINRHEQRIIEANQKILETIGTTLKDKKIDARVKLQITKLMNLSAGGGGGSTTGMNSADKLELAKGFLNNADSIIGTLRNGPDYSSLIRNIDDQLEIYRKEIQELDKERENSKDEKVKGEIQRNRERAISKSD